MKDLCRGLFSQEPLSELAEADCALSQLLRQQFAVPQQDEETEDVEEEQELYGGFGKSGGRNVS